MLDSDADPGLLARVLLTLGRRCATGELEVESGGGRRGIVTLRRGGIARIDHADGGARVLGDLLAADGALERELALDDTGRVGVEPIGRYLVRTGRISRGAVEHALRKQMRGRLRTLFGWERPRLGFRALEENATDVAIPVGEAVIDALRDVAAREELAKPHRGSSSESYALTAFGRELLSGVPLRPEEAAVAAMLDRAVSPAALSEAMRGNARALRFVAMLRRIGAAESLGGSGSYSLLLRKRQELRRSPDPRTLLGIGPTDSPAEARRALRRLARDLHPDRFEGADAGTRHLSAEVLRALVAAEAEIASGRPPAPRSRAK